MTGHGVFNAYLYSRKRRTNAQCPCGTGAENVSHILLNCPLFINGRLFDWSELTADRITYMEKTIEHLWVKEDPSYHDR